MENAQFEHRIAGTTLYFSGCDLIDAEYDEKPGEVPHGTNWFEDETGARHEIEVDEDTPHPHGGDDQQLFAHISIDGRQIQSLEILEGGMGTFYVKRETDDCF